MTLLDAHLVSLQVVLNDGGAHGALQVLLVLLQHRLYQGDPVEELGDGVLRGQLLHLDLQEEQSVSRRPGGSAHIRAGEGTWCSFSWTTGMRVRSSAHCASMRASSERRSPVSTFFRRSSWFPSETTALFRPDFPSTSLENSCGGGADGVSAASMFSFVKQRKSHQEGSEVIPDRLQLLGNQNRLRVPELQAL